MNIETIAAKIQRLIAKADSSTHEEEADTFMTKAQALMEQHGLSLLDLGRLDAEDPVGETTDDELRNNGSARWRFVLAGQLARYYGCKLIGDQRGSFLYWHLFGRESGRVTFQLMWPYVVRQVMKLGNEGAKAGHYSSGKNGHKAVALALASRIGAMASAEERRRNAATGTTSSQLNALVPVDMIRQCVEQAFPKLRTTKSRFTYDPNAAKAAAGVNLDTQLRRSSGGTRPLN